MAAFWTIVVYVFVIAVLATVAYATVAMFGGFHRPQH